MASLTDRFLELQRENERLTKQNQEQKEQIKALEAEIRRNRIQMNAAGESAGVFGKSVTDQYEKELKEITEQRDYLSKQVKRLEHALPMDILEMTERANRLLPAQTGSKFTITLIGASFFFRDNRDSKVTGYKFTGDFLGSKQEAIREIGSQMTYAMFRIPAPSDFSGAPDWLNGDERVIILKKLAYFFFIEPDKYESERYRLFDEAWEKNKGKDYQGIRKKAYDSFVLFCNRTFQHQRNRITRTIIEP